MSNKNEQYLWALSLIDTAQYIEGITRLQKYAFLAAKRIKGITEKGFYDDWQASNYGPFSKELAKDICFLIENNLIKNETKPNKYGYKVSFLTPTESGKKEVKWFENNNQKIINEIKKITNIYQSKRLMDILHDVYYLYPQYAIQSRVRAQVDRQIYDSDSYLNPEYDNSNE